MKSKMKHKAVVFDLDGTLLDTLDDLADSLNRVLQAKGFPPHPVDLYRYFVGDGAAMLVTRALPQEKRNTELVNDCLGAFRKDYGLNWKVKTKLYAGVPELLNTLTAKNIQMAIFTNKPQNFAELCIQEFLSGWNFAMVVGQKEGFPMKPDPAGAYDIAQTLNIPVQEFLYLGDSGVDMTTAINAGMFPVGASWGFRSEKELREHGALEVINQPTDLLKVLK